MRLRLEGAVDLSRTPTTRTGQRVGRLGTTRLEDLRIRRSGRVPGHAPGNPLVSPAGDGNRAPTMIALLLRRERQRSTIGESLGQIGM